MCALIKLMGDENTDWVTDTDRKVDRAQIQIYEMSLITDRPIGHEQKIQSCARRVCTGITYVVLKQLVDKVISQSTKNESETGLIID